MSEQEAERAVDALREAVNRDVAQLIHHLRCSHAPDDTLSAAIDHVQQAVQLLRPWLQEGTGWSTVTIADKGAGVPFSYQDLVWLRVWSILALALAIDCPATPSAPALTLPTLVTVTTPEAAETLPIVAVCVAALA